MFNEQKAAQVAAWFIGQSGGVMPHLKLMKLMYLAERESMKRSGYPMMGDRLVALKHGPVLSQTLNHINDAAPSSPLTGWDSWVSDRADNQVALVKPLCQAELDELSRADLAVLGHVWAECGHMSKYQIRDYTHRPDICPEWRNPGDSMLPIAYADVFRALGYGAEQAAEMAAEVEAQHAIDTALAA
jgi:uncharacterized phage-associated protein